MGALLHLAFIICSRVFPFVPCHAMKMNAKADKKQHNSISETRQSKDEMQERREKRENQYQVRRILLSFFPPCKPCLRGP